VLWQRNPSYNPSAHARTAERPRADILVLDHDGKATALDLVITHPNVTSVRHGNAGAVPGKAAQSAYDSKQTKYAQQFDLATGASFVPFAIETGGRLHPKAREALVKFVRSLIDNDPEKYTPEEKLFYSRSLRGLLDVIDVARAQSVAFALLGHSNSSRSGRARLAETANVDASGNTGDGEADDDE